MKKLAIMLSLGWAAAVMLHAADQTAKPAFAIYFNSEVRGAVDPCG